MRIDRLDRGLRRARQDIVLRHVNGMGRQIVRTVWCKPLRCWHLGQKNVLLCACTIRRIRPFLQRKQD